MGLIIILDPNWYTPKKIYVQKDVTAHISILIYGLAPEMPAVTGSWIGPDYHTRSLRVYTKKDICTEGCYSHSGAKTEKRCHPVILKIQNDRMQKQNDTMTVISSVRSQDTTNNPSINFDMCYSSRNAGRNRLMNLAWLSH